MSNPFFTGYSNRASPSSSSPNREPSATRTYGKRRDKELRILKQKDDVEVVSHTEDVWVELIF